jgi:AmpD protein
VNKPGELWLPGIRHVPSPNADARPLDATIDLLVIHNISLPPGEFGGGHIEALFLNRLDPLAHPYFADVAHLQVSAHVLIRRTGEVIQFVALERRAWHAGKSAFCGRECCNDFSIGIELEGTDETPFSEAQYAQLVDITRKIRRHFPLITDDHIVGHADIAPDRKTDPGPAFDWSHYRGLMLAAASGRPAPRS